MKKLKHLYLVIFIGLLVGCTPSIKEEIKTPNESIFSLNGDPTYWNGAEPLTCEWPNFNKKAEEQANTSYKFIPDGTMCSPEPVEITKDNH